MMRRPRYARCSTIVVNDETRRKLEQQTRGRSTPARAVMRSRIILLAADCRPLCEYRSAQVHI